MTKNKKTLLIVGIVLASILLVALLALVFFGDPREETPTDEMTYTVLVKNSTDTPLEGVGVYIYEDETQAELVWFDKTNAEGKMFFTAPASDKYVAVLGNVPTGYAAQEQYPITGELTEIVLDAGKMSEEDMKNLSYKLGDLMMDFTVTDTDGVEYTLSELLKTKKAVVLNFWYLECVPCKMEFPFMQEAYEKYKDDLEILAMNPVNTSDEDIAAFKKELGLAFPMAKVDALWEQMMALTAYPTTVMIDRFGNIVLIHKGSVDSADTFEQLFAYFTAEDYEPKAIENLEDIVTKTEGSEENPSIPTDSEFEVTLEPGESYYLNLYKITETVYLSVKGEDFTLTYKEKEYKPSNGSLTITISSEGPSTPVELIIKNTGDKKQTYYFSKYFPKGSAANPYRLSLGEFDINTSAGNEKGTFGTYTAEKSGTLTVRCLKSSVSKYGFYLYNLRSYAMRNTDEDGKTDEEGCLIVSVQVKKGDKIQFSVAVARDENNYIAAGSFRFELELTEGDGEDEVKPEPSKTTYTINITDEAGAPVGGVGINLKGEFTYEPTEEDPEDLEAQDIKVDVNLTADENGTVTTEQVSGPYTATIKIPEGYTLEKTQYALTAENPTVTVKLQKIVYKDYTVQVNYPDGAPVSDVIVIVGSGVGFTNETGSVTFNLAEGDYTALIIGIPDGYILPETAYTLTKDKTEVTAVLGHGPGAESNPIVVRNQTAFDTGELAPEEKEYYTVYGVGGSTLRIQNANAYVIVNGGEPVYANSQGRVSVPIQESNEPISLVVGNHGALPESYTVEFEFPLGTVQNPDAPKANIRRFSISPGVGDEDGYYLSWTPERNGLLTLTLRKSSATNCDVVLSYDGVVAKMSESETANTVSIRLKKGVPVLIQGIAIPEADGSYPAIKIDLSGTLAYDPVVEGMTDYSVTVTDESAAPQVGLKVQFVKDGAPVGDPVETDARGVAEASLATGTYTVKLLDETLIYDTVTLTESAPAATIVVSWSAPPVEDGKTRYSVTVTDFDGNMIGDVVVLFLQNGSPVGYSIVGENGGAVTADLPTGSYDVQLAFIKDQGYRYEEVTAKVSAGSPSVRIPVTATVPGAAVSNWALGTVRPVKVGGTYVPLQADIVNHFSFQPSAQGVYQFTTSDPNAVISYWGDVNYPADMTAELEDYANNTFTRSVNTNALGQNLVVGITGASDCILIITRVGDAAEDVPYEEYKTQTPPTEYTFSGQKLTFVDLTASSDTYRLVYDETNGYYRLGSTTGPIMYVQLDANKKDAANPVDPPYVPLYKMVGGVDNTGTGFKCTYKDAEGNEVREDYTALMLAYGKCADDTYGVYPLTKDLVYMLQMGGGYQGWWDAEDKKGNLLFKDDEGVLDPTINLDIAWMFACCYVE